MTDDWIHTPIEDRYAAATRMANDARYVRARLAASRAIALANTLADLELPLVTAPEDDPMWSVRGETRTRQTFAQPHPDDFPGGLPTPSEYITAAASPTPAYSPSPAPVPTAPATPQP